jgi:hypothetical protein
MIEVHRLKPWCRGLRQPRTCLRQCDVFCNVEVVKKCATLGHERGWRSNLLHDARYLEASPSQVSRREDRFYKRRLAGARRTEDSGNSTWIHNQSRRFHDHVVIRQ